MNEHSKIQRIVELRLQDLANSGYIVPENADNEVAGALQITASNIATAVIEGLELTQYVKIDGKFYHKETILKSVKPKEHL